MLGIARGIAQGFERAGRASRQMEEDERIKARDEREKTAFDTQQKAAGLQMRLAETQVADAERKAAADKERDERVSAITRARAEGSGDFAQLIDPEMAGARTAVQQKVGDQSDAESRRLGLTTPEQMAQAPSRSISAGAEQNVFLAPGMKLYADQQKADDLEYDLKTKVLQDYYNKTGQIEKAMALPEVAADLKEKKFSRNLRIATSAMAAGVPGSLGAFNSIYSNITDGYSVDPKSGKYDDEIGGFRGVRILDSNGKVIATEDWGREKIAQIAMMADPAKAMQYQIELGLKKREVVAKERAAAADEKKASAAVTSAGANAQIARTNAETRADSAAVQNDIRKQESLRSSYQLTAPFVIKTADEVKALIPSEKKAYEQAKARYEQNTSRFNAASSISALNPDLKVGEITEAVRVLEQRALQGKSADGVDGSGRAYVTVGGKKILLPLN